ncbi:hypothetical protein VTN96DRAFT_7900 [Rasamsonia emersonii]
MRFSIALVSLSLSALALAGSSNYLNLFDNPSCAGEPYGEYGIYHSDECHTGQPELNRVQSVNTVLIENGCYILGFKQPNCTGTGVMVSSPDPNTCISASSRSDNVSYWQSFMLKNCQ